MRFRGEKSKARGRETLGQAFIDVYPPLIMTIKKKKIKKTALNVLSKVYYINYVNFDI